MTGGDYNMQESMLNEGNATLLTGSVERYYLVEYLLQLRGCPNMIGINIDSSCLICQSLLSELGIFGKWIRQQFDE